MIVCQGAFRRFDELGNYKFEHLQRHLSQNGVVPRVHGNKRRKPKHALSFPVVENMVKFIKTHAEVFGIPHPAPLHGRASIHPIYLPAFQNYKTVHKTYVESCRPDNKRAVGLSSFRSIWHQCLPHIQFMTARTDVCHKCEVYRRQVADAVGDAQKLTACTALSDHVVAAQQEREFYK